MTFIKKAFPALLLIGAVAVLAAVLLPEDENVEEAPASAGMGGFRFAVTFAEVTAGEVVEEVELVGDVVSRRRARLSFERGGRVREVLVDLGDEVPAGTVLARLDDTVLEEELKIAEFQARSTRGAAEFAARDAERARVMGSTVFPEAERDRRVTEAETARYLAEQKDVEVLRLQALLAQGELKAPFDAVVTMRPITDGSYVVLGEEAFELVDLVNRELHLEIPAQIAAGLKAGAPLTIRSDEMPSLRIETTLDRLVPAADPGTRTFRGVVYLQEEDPGRRLLPGMFIRVRLARRAVDSATLVPADALLAGPRGTVVVRIADPPADTGEGAGGPPPSPVAVFVPVQVLARSRDRVAVAPHEPGQLSTGDRVVVTGVDNVFPGAPLAPRPHVTPAGPVGG